MGIRGLTTYIVRHADQYLEAYDLHDTYLVIDGNSIASQLYNWHAHCYCAFGGDYDKYAQCAREFFDSLIKCKITPLVLIDGGYENKKVSTVYSRLKSKIQTASHFTPSERKKFFPLLMKEVFRDVMDERGVRYAQCAFEADNEIAAIARILECPVLSYDSDFFVYGVLYIPFDTLDNGVVKREKTNGYLKRCKIYRVENFLNSFGGLDGSLLPLVATLLGNDYIKRSVFKQFFTNLKLSKITKKNSNEQQRRIAALLNWLKRHTLNSAVAAVLMRIQSAQRHRILKKMETIINGYNNLYPSILPALGFSQEDITRLKCNKVIQAFKFQGDFKSLENLAEIKIDESSSASDEDDDDDDDDDDNDEVETVDKYDPVDVSVEKYLSKIAPPWFIIEFNRGQLPAYFIDMMYRQVYFCPPQIEDYFYPSAHMISLKVVGVIFKLLTSFREDLNKNLQYVIRDVNQAARYELQSCEEIFSGKHNLLNDLNELPLVTKTQILTQTLEVPEELIMDVLPKWTLYVATIVYWAQQKQAPLVTNCHVYSLLCAMLFGIIDEKVGFYRSHYKFSTKYSSQIRDSIEKRNSVKNQIHSSENTNMKSVYDSITTEDCLLAAPFFISNFKPDSKTLSNPKVFNVTIVHSFAQFQSCLRHFMHLNALLGFPFAQSKVAEVYNGTLLYNLYNNFKKRNDVEAYINVVLKDSPSLLKLFKLLSKVIREPLNEVFDYKVNQKRKRKNRNKPKEIDSDENMCSVSGDEGSDKSPKFIDPNNLFCMLNDSTE